MNYSAIFRILVAVLVCDQAQASYKVVCYYTDWSFYRTGNGKFVPADIDTTLCTHIVYAFTTLDPNSLTIQIADSWADTDSPQDFYKQVTDFQQKGVKVSVAIGGWSDSVGSKYGKLLTNENSRQNFITSVVNFIEKYNFDGLDLDLEYPGCWQGDCESSDASQKTGFATLIQELSQVFKPRGWLLSAPVSTDSDTIDAAYDVPKLAEYLDWIAIMAYDFHVGGESKTGANAPLYNYAGNSGNFYADYAVKYWIQKGAPSTKLVLGTPSYGNTFTLSNSANHGFNAASSGAGQAGQYTQEAGELAYYEICDNINNHGWTVVRSTSNSPYAYKGNQWVSFDDVATMTVKAQYIRSSNLGGAMIWTLDMDDFKGTCGGGKYPLLTALKQGLN